MSCPVLHRLHRLQDVSSQLLQLSDLTVDLCVCDDVKLKHILHLRSYTMHTAQEYKLLAVY